MPKPSTALSAPEAKDAATASAPTPPAFLITIDTEGDDLWARPRHVTTQNARFLGRFQALCERFGLKPTYLTNFEMAGDPVFHDLATDALRRGTAEIGMHMHAWDSPPVVPLGDRDWHHQPYAFEYPPELVDQKADVMTRLLEDRFAVPVTSHRAGRWGFDAAYARTLLRLGYRVDCSVTPLVSWQDHPGAPAGTGGADFRRAPAGSYFLDLDDVCRPGNGALLEVPMTIMEGVRSWPRSLARRVLGRSGPKIVWLRPDGANLDDLLFIVGAARLQGRPYIQFTLHSSEFMPGGSPTFRTKASIERLYRHMEALFEAAHGHFVGRTLSDYAAEIAGRTTETAAAIPSHPT